MINNNIYYQMEKFIVAEYIWIDINLNLRSKSRTIFFDGKERSKFLENNLTFPEWNFDGSSTGQAESSDSEIILKPVSFFKDPLRLDLFLNIDCYLVLCDCYDKNDKAITSNTRFNANEIFENEKVKKEKIWFGLEQEYILYNLKTNRILGWPKNGLPKPQGKYYCGIGADRTFGRKIIEEHYYKCLIANIKIAGINEEVLPGQWEFQIGPCEGIQAADQLWIARYILQRVCEKYKIKASFKPKPKVKWNGSGLHANISTTTIRESTNMDNINDAINKLEKNHSEHIKVYGDNSKRLSGFHETSRIDKFTSGIADRTASIRIPSSVFKTKNFYIEDRRPSSDCDPYPMTSIIAKTILFD